MYSREEIYAATIGRNKQNLQPLFIEFLFSLGIPTVAELHSSWSGNVKTSYRIGYVLNNLLEPIETIF